MTDLPVCLRDIERQEWVAEKLQAKVKPDGTTAIQLPAGCWVMDWHVGIDMVVTVMIMKEKK